jgi:raffinose/stachyose/melibiose transport system substrate-binding protein
MVTGNKKSPGVYLLLIAAVLAGCTRSADITPDQIELGVLNYLDLSSAKSPLEISRVWDAFSAANPDIKIVREDLFNEPFHRKVEAYTAAGNLPDVVYAWPSGRSAGLHTQSLLKDLSPLIQRDDLGSFMLPGAFEQGDDYVGILPQAMTSSHVFFANKEVLRAVGLSPAKTYEELKAQVPVLKAKGYQTVLMANEDIWVMQSCLFSLILGRFCGPDWEQGILGGKTQFTDPDFIAAFNFIKTLFDDGVLSKETLSTSYGNVVTQFAHNLGAYMIDGDWRIGAFLTDPSSGSALISPQRQRDIDIGVFPDIEGAKLNRSTSGILGTGWGMNADISEGSPEEEAAWTLVKWLSGKEVQTWLLESGKIITPTRTDIDVSTMTLEPLQIAGSNLGNRYRTITAVIDGVFPSEIYLPINEGLHAIGMGTLSPLQAAEQAQEALDEWKSKQ